MQKTRRRTLKGLAASALRARPSWFQKTRSRRAASVSTRVNTHSALARGCDGPLEIAQSTARFSSGSSRPPKGSGHGGPFEGAARRPRCGLRWRRWTWLFALSSCITWRASDFRRRSCAVTIARVHRCTQLLAPRRTLAGLTEGGGACPSRVLKFHRPGVFITLAARFFRLRAPSMSCTQ